MTYTVHVEPDETNGGYYAWVDERPGILGQGETVPDTLRDVADALEMVE